MIKESVSRDHPVEGSSASRFVGALDEAVRQNPVPAALIGVGILWLFAGGRNATLGGTSHAVASGIGRGAQETGAAAYRGARAATGRVVDGMHAVAESATDVGAHALEGMKSAAGVIGSTVNQTGAVVGEAASRAASWSKQSAEMDERSRSSEPLGGTAGSLKGAQDALADLFARQPLMLGAVGVAIGAAIAASLPVSQNENRLMGDTADAVMDQAGKLWDETKRRGAELASKGLKEAEAQGLTPAAAAQAIRTTATKVAGFAEKSGADLVDRTTRR